MAEKMTKERATQLMMGDGYHCSQTVITHIAEVLGLDRDLLVKITAGLGGGCRAERNHGRQELRYS